MVSPLDRAELSTDSLLPYSRPQDDLFYSGSGLVSLRQRNAYTTNEEFVIGTNGSGAGTIRIDGCGLSPLIFSYSSENPRLSYKNLLIGLEKTAQNCVLTGIVVPKDRPDNLVFALIVEIFSKKIVNLEQPEVSATKDRVTFSSTGPVSWTFVNEKAFNKASVKADIENGNFILRQVTAVGRTVVIKYENGTEVWSR